MKKYPTAELHYTSLKSSQNGVPLCFHQLQQIRVIFVYGMDFERQPIYFGVLHYWINNYQWINFVIIILFVIILYCLRRRASVRMDGSWLEVIAVVIGGGIIRVHHKLEKVFFGISLISFFFLISIFLADFSMHSIISERFEKIDTFEKLAKRNVTFYYGPRLGYRIKYMLM